MITQNRMVLAAMTNKQSHVDGTLSKNEINWLVRRAKGGFGIITTAATNVSLKGKAWEGEFGVYDDIHIPSLKKLTSAIHQATNKACENNLGVIVTIVATHNCVSCKGVKHRGASMVTTNTETNRAETKEVMPSCPNCNKSF